MSYAGSYFFCVNQQIVWNGVFQENAFSKQPYLKRYMICYDSFWYIVYLTGVLELSAYEFLLSSTNVT